MELEKLKNLNDAELSQQERTAGEQLFRLRFQMKLGQNEGVKKLRELKKDIARIKTIARQRSLGQVVAPVTPSAPVKSKKTSKKEVR